MSLMGDYDDVSRVVWVLGAGFSRSLDGPLLNNFFTESLTMRLHVATEQSDSRLAGRTRELKALYGLDKKEERGLEAGLPWSNPEDFVAYVSAANDETPAGKKRARFLRSRPKPWTDLDALARACRTYLALACWEFWHEADFGSELWAPYVNWTQRLESRGHTVITFNYDEVCERAAWQAGKSDEWLAKPPTNPSPFDDDGSSLLLKLHGSCLWSLPDNPRSSAQLEVLPTARPGQDPKELIAAFADPENTTYEAAIGVPGPDKATMSDQRFPALWMTAEKRLKAAHAIVFIGYSIPKADNYAKQKILTAIRESEERYLSIHIVLGALDTDGTAARLVGMVEWALKSQRRRIHYDEAELRRYNLAVRERMENAPGTTSERAEACQKEFRREPRRAFVQVHRLFAEDFLTVVDIDRLDPFSGWRRNREKLAGESK